MIKLRTWLATAGMKLAVRLGEIATIGRPRARRRFYRSLLSILDEVEERKQ